MGTQVQTRQQAEDRKLFIGGEFIDAAGGATFETIHPASEEHICNVAKGGAEDIDRAVASAREAFPEWRSVDPEKRQHLLSKLADLLHENKDELAELEVLDTGKPIREARMSDIPESVRTFNYFSGWPTKIYGDTNPSGNRFLSYTVREPWGVVGAITPWNFPLQMASWKVAPALACGNCVVLKPAEQTPLTALRLAELASEAGIPDGVLNVVPGFGGEAGQALVEHEDVNKIAFTGSSETGKHIMQTAAENLTPVNLELGGKSPNIVLADANLDLASKFAHAGIFWNQGQLCTAGSRLLVEDEVYDEFVGKLKGSAEWLEPGDPFDDDTHQGALISEQQFDKVLSYIDKGKQEANLVTGGEPHPKREEDGGFWVKPTIFTDVDNEQHSIAREEIFGPVLSVMKVNGLDEALEIGNDTFYGLAAGVWTSDISKAHRAAKELQAGTVWINTYNEFDPAVPFGGYKGSGFGRELGKEAIDLYTQKKSVFINTG